ncbi:hypothetical protein PLICRDRAFT_175340 [Plicaturopsis crispa FD-325 SS-3]|nr:hypothetical protein PLICRDRAFT_175340 [Plicaturopsis crispa FD-325 SS-3]
MFRSRRKRSAHKSHTKSNVPRAKSPPPCESELTNEEDDALLAAMVDPVSRALILQQAAPEVSFSARVISRLMCVERGKTMDARIRTGPAQSVISASPGSNSTLTSYARRPYAFHPMDGFAQSIPYHLFAFLFPMHRILYLVLFVLVNFWTIFIHDSDMITDHPLEKIINGPAHHTLHHLYFTVNYGQYFTLADRIGNSYRQPDASLDPLLEVKRLDGASKKSQ